MVDIREFDFEKDIRAILSLEKKTFAEDAFPIFEFAILYQKCGETFLVAYQDEQLVGYVSAYAAEGIAYIASIAVDSHFRRRGIAAKLMTSIIGILSSKEKASLLELHVRISNFPAINFYQSLGFKVISKDLKYYNDEDAYLMSLTLASP